MNSDLTPVPLEAASPVRNIVSNGTRARSALTLMGFITPNSRAESRRSRGSSIESGLATGQANENSIRHPHGVLDVKAF